MIDRALARNLWLFLGVCSLSNTASTQVLIDVATNVKRDSTKIRFLDELDGKLQTTLNDNDLFDYMHDEIISNNDSIIFEKTVETALLKERLKALNASTPFDIEYNIILEGVIAKYLKRNTTYMEKVMTLSDYYFPMIEATLDKYDIPLEMKYLAIIESSLNPRIKSRMGAAGLWQFMYATGRNYELDVTSYVDERMDPIKSTEAACKYLRVLYDMYGDWDLALAAYNCGPGNVNKAIKRSGGSTNYWELRKYLPRETANYVPAFQATMYIYQYAAAHGYRPGATNYKHIETDTILVKNMVSLEKVAQFVDEDLETIQFLNPSYKLDIIPVIPGKQNFLRLPRQAATTFIMSEDEAYVFADPKGPKPAEPVETEVTTLAATSAPSKKSSTQRLEYTVRNGDYLGKIAERYDVGVSEIRAWNNLKGNNLKVGQKLAIHSKNGAVSGSKDAKVPKIYTVKGGDSYWKIARKYGLTIVVIKKLNPQVKDLKPGVKLRLS